MSEQLTILKNQILPDESNYTWLREQGMEYIRALSDKLWTDHNTHDPGITILEVLCYALTECSYRSDFEINDLIARLQGESKKDFYTAKEILTCNSTTVLDIKKYIIDLDNVQNAWLNKLINPKDVTFNNSLPFIDEPSFNYKCDIDKKDYDIKLTQDNTYEKKYLNGLYNVILELEEDEEFGDLNSNVIEWPVIENNIVTANLKIIFPRVEIQFPSWDYEIRKYIEYRSFTSLEANVEGDGKVRTLATLKLTCDKDNTKIIDYTLLNQVISVFIEPVNETLPDNNKINAVLMNVPDSENSFGNIVFKRYKKILSIIKNVYCALQNVRNLCEDYVKFTLVPQQEILLCADIEVEPDADLETVLSEVYFRIDTFLAPPVKFYNLLEMIEKGKTTEEIFNGQVLEHGFIADEELAESELRTEIHTSDIYNIIMSIEGVTAITYLQITNYLDGAAQISNDPWRIKLFGAYSLNLSKVSNKKIHFYKSGLEFFADNEQVDMLIKTLKAQNSKPKLMNLESDFPVPYGNFRNLSDYYSLQNDFPDVYKTGRNGITTLDSKLRIARTKQLKAYLLFFDQILVNFFGQLNLAKELLSLESSLNISRTYVSMPVYDSPGNPFPPNFFHIQNLLKDFTKSLTENTELDDEASYKTQWDLFANNPGNDYLKSLSEITESKELYFERRNIFLDHLIARFAESFNKYVTVMHQMFGNKSEEDMINDKSAFLNDYPMLSSQRGKGFQYKCCDNTNLNPDGWPGANISGLQRRSSRLLGIDVPDDNQLVPIGDETFLKTGFNILSVSPGSKYKFQFDVNSDVLLESPDLFNSKKDCELSIFNIIMKGINIENYEIDSNDDFKFTLRESRGQILAQNPISYESEEIANGKIETLINEFGTGAFHIVHVNDKFRFNFEIDDNILLESPLNILFSSEEDCNTAISNVVRASSEADNYVVIKNSYGKFQFNLHQKDDKIIAINNGKPGSKSAALERIFRIIDTLKKLYYREGFHIIEHILLRPVKGKKIIAADINDGYFPLCKMNEDCECPIEDYYSFRVTVVFPFWPDRFRNMNFRRFAEELLRYEAPAHIFLKICWVDVKDMYEFETCYSNWVKLVCEYLPDVNILDHRITELIKKINNLTNIYPEGVLHDCEHPSEEEAIILNQSMLGAFDDLENENNN